MNFFPVIENKRVLLEPLQPAHLEALLPIALQPALWTVGALHIDSRAGLEQYIANALAERTAQTSIPFVVTDKKEQRIAGCTRYSGIALAHKRSEIGYTWIDTALQGSGLNKAMKFAMLQYAFEVMDLNRIEFKTDELNTQSRNAILSIGCTQEGILRHHMITSKGRVRNTVYFSMLKEEWPEVKQRVFGKYDF
ncbi:GNAT family N-acetyltransferase [Chitinophaga nivalis]|uniref:GNAT family N-acetyltransferase n=1 Tax=Chitinophaga nivalis TaxID=2991709 RepID=A0ABT3IRS9_9BACT|nr:GNAT family protein [Chitinophaga nivalis]MCW3463632.1 GNAT family N-acetyltransferase [Chitinophaga nivalis]MCW3486678.1 GNAT family N-acetyltransferase [Chitinophaga nivalis]